MMKTKLLFLALVVGVVGVGSAHAHHSFAATYFVDRTITIKGTITQFEFRNPHSFIKVSAPDDKGVMQDWAIEWGGGGQLAGDHVTRDTLKPGDQVTIVGNPGRDPSEHRIRLNNIARPADGWKWGGVVR
jgi:hypothetical protein